MTDHSELIARLRSRKSDIDVEAYDLAADALETQAREIAAQREDVAKTTQIAFDRFHYKQECKRLEARLVEAERDAARYRWLTQIASPAEALLYLSLSDADEAIDKAMEVGDESQRDRFADA